MREPSNWDKNKELGHLVKEALDNDQLIIASSPTQQWDVLSVYQGHDGKLQIDICTPRPKKEAS